MYFKKTCHCSFKNKEEAMRWGAGGVYREKTRDIRIGIAPYLMPVTHTQNQLNSFFRFNLFEKIKFKIFL